MSDTSPVRVAAVQAPAFPFNKNGAVDTVCAMTAEAAAEGARLDPLSGGVRRRVPVGARVRHGRRRTLGCWTPWHSDGIGTPRSMSPGPRSDRMGAAARDAGVWLCVGVIERDTTYSTGTLFCTLLYFGPDGTLLGKHRKLKPTAAERLIWGEGDGSTLTTVDTDFGRVGGLICWENYMPLARMAMYGKGIHIHLAPTADARDRWQSTLQHIALEGRCFRPGVQPVRPPGHVSRTTWRSQLNWRPGRRR